MLIRDASETDIDACLGITDSYWKKEDFQNSIDNPNAIFLVAEVDDNIVGYINGFIVPTKNNEAMIHESRIKDEQRGQKYGSRLVDEFCEVAYEAGADIVYAMIEPELKAFYIDSCKFKNTGQWVEASRSLK